MKTKSQTYKSITTDTYNQIADEYIARDHQTIDESKEVNESVKKFADLIPAGSTILDIGIGGGRDARLFAGLGFRIVGIDIAAKLLQKGSKLENTGLIEYLEMDLEDLRFPEDSFVAIWANASLHHIPKKNLPSVLHSIKLILKPDGYLQIKMHRGLTEGIEEENKFNSQILRYFANYELEEIVQVLKDVGFEIIEAKLATKDKWVDLLVRKV